MNIKIAIIRFPGSNCDQDARWACESFPGVMAYEVWHQDRDLKGAHGVILPGGFSYGDYLRCGAIAQFSPIMREVKAHAAQGGLVLGICNGFQILCEMGLLPGALMRNRDLRFVCASVGVRVETSDTPLTQTLASGKVLHLPIAHGEGCYFADAAVLKSLEENQQVLFRYTQADGVMTALANPNGSCESIAGICNRSRNIFGLMPHPERACHAELGSEDGRPLLASFFQACQKIAKTHLSPGVAVCV